MPVIPLEIVILASDAQPENAFAGILSAVPVSVTFFILAYESGKSSSMRAIKANGIATFVNAEHPSKASDPMLATLSGIVTFES